jgi:hypothetical protein
VVVLLLLLLKKKKATVVVVSLWQGPSRAVQRWPRRLLQPVDVKPAIK